MFTLKKKKKNVAETPAAAENAEHYEAFADAKNPDFIEENEPSASTAKADAEAATTAETMSAETKSANATTAESPATEISAEAMVADDEAAQLAAFEAWLEDSMPDAGRRNAAREAFASVAEALKAGKHEAAMFEVIAKGADYDRAVEEARTLGELDGRNTAVQDLFDPLRQGDGLPQLGTVGVHRPDRTPSIFDVARGVGNG